MTARATERTAAEGFAECGAEAPVRTFVVTSQGSACRLPVRSIPQRDDALAAAAELDSAETQTMAFRKGLIGAVTYAQAGWRPCSWTLSGSVSRRFYPICHSSRRERL